MGILTYPEVYVKEVLSGIHTIAGVSTFITMFLGRSIKGQLDKQKQIKVSEINNDVFRILRKSVNTLIIDR